MAVNGWLAADSDMHVMEPADLWQRYMDPRWGHAIPVGLEELERDMRVKVKNEVLLRLGPMRPQAAGRAWKSAQDSAFVHAEAQHWDAASQVMAMEMEHLDSAVFFPSRGLFVLAMQSAEHIGPNGLEPELAAAIARGYNDWMADFVSDCRRPGRVFGAAMLAPHDVSSAVDELTRNVERGFVAAFVAPGLVDNKPWHDHEVRPTVAGGRASRRPDLLPRGRRDLAQARLRLQRASRQAHAVALVQSAAGHHVRRHLLHLGRHTRTFPHVAGRAPRRQLLVGSLHDVPARRALGVDR